MEGERKALKRRVGQGHIKLNCIEVQRKNGRKKKSTRKAKHRILLWGRDTAAALMVKEAKEMYICLP
jgi:hypothetical protein